MSPTSDDDITLRPLQPEEFADYRARFIRDWAADIARVDQSSLEHATIQASQRTDASLPHGIATNGHQLYAIVCGDERVGTLWFSVDAERHAFLDDITINEACRRRGYGRRALELFEAKSREMGLERIDLHVYRDNPGAIALYEKLGYHVTGLKMRKALGPK